MFMKTGQVAFFLSMVSEVTIQKNSKEALPKVEKLTVHKLVIEFWAVTSKLSFGHLQTFAS